MQGSAYSRWPLIQKAIPCSPHRFNNWAIQVSWGSFRTVSIRCRSIGLCFPFNTFQANITHLPSIFAWIGFKPASTYPHTLAADFGSCRINLATLCWILSRFFMQVWEITDASMQYRIDRIAHHSHNLCATKALSSPVLFTPMIVCA